MDINKLPIIIMNLNFIKLLLKLKMKINPIMLKMNYRPDQQMVSVWQKLLNDYRNREIFSDHRENKFLNRFHSTQTVKEIDKLIASYRAPQIKAK